MILLDVILSMMEPADDEADLVAKAKAGDRDAFGELVRRYQKRVYRVARRMCRTDEDAWDVTQDTFVRAMKAMPGFDTRYRFFTWIYRIATNLSINLSEKRRRRSEVEFDEEYGAEGEQCVEDTAASQASASELADAIRKAVERLSPPLRSVFVLRVDQELSYSEIAETLGIALGTVMSRLSRARSEVRKSVEHLMES
ncbi:MAG TPA: sigma-70 family RNA polymerase sigma factor [Candidatus Fermentibacter sp.]|nr:sigma-70 family RNA polymerase sigma factor [Candidatus Fermentibacter sp.]